MTRNAFLIVRFIFFSLLVYLSILTISFVAWNIHATLSSSLTVSASVAILLFNSCLTVLLVGLALAELAFPRLKSQVRLECALAAFLSLFQIGACIGLTADNYFTSCREGLEWRICASSFLLVPCAWLSSFTVLTYLITLLFMTMAHDGVWSHSIYAVDWLSKPEATQPVNAKEDSWTLYLNNLERQTCSSQPADVEKAPWAQIPIRRGIDLPFVKKNDRTHSSSSSVYDEDKPIPLPRLSEWYRADILQPKRAVHA